ncbi:MAG: hypothetical protein QXY88_00200 [Candidatus Bathyarchaeia archaeon]
MKENAKYSEVQEAVNVSFQRMKRTGGLFWLLAKYTCRAQNPKCKECPLTELCDYGKKHI